MIVSLEGVSGVGKTYLCGQLERAYAAAADLGGRRFVHLPEFSERAIGGGDGIDLAILREFRKRADGFFRIGLPRTESLILMALKAHDYERYLYGATNDIVIEGRGIDTLAIYQTLRLCEAGPSQGWHRGEAATMDGLLGQLSFWREPPALTFLFLDDLIACVDRAERRNGKEYSPQDKQMLAGADRLYRLLASKGLPRIRVIDRTVLSESECVEVLARELGLGLGKR